MGVTDRTWRSISFSAVYDSLLLCENRSPASEWATGNLHPVVQEARIEWVHVRESRTGQFRAYATL